MPVYDMSKAEDREALELELNTMRAKAERNRKIVKWAKRLHIAIKNEHHSEVRAIRQKLGPGSYEIVWNKYNELKDTFTNS